MYFVAISLFRTWNKLYQIFCYSHFFKGFVKEGRHIFSHTLFLRNIFIIILLLIHKCSFWCRNSYILYYILCIIFYDNEHHNFDILLRKNTVVSHFKHWNVFEASFVIIRVDICIITFDVAFTKYKGYN